MFLGGEHIYLSTACLHGQHQMCRLECKYCGAPCWCDHHYPKGTDVSEQPETLDNPATPDSDGDGSLDDIQPGAQPNEANDAGYLAGEDGDDDDPTDAQERDTDEEGDPDAADPGDVTEPASDTDPEPQLNDDADDNFTDLPDGEDNDDDLDGDDDDGA